MNKFDSAVQYVLCREGSLSTDPNDHGGITKYGISLRFLKSLSTEDLRKYGVYSPEIVDQDIVDLTMEQAKEIYLGEFWNHAPFDKINVQAVCNFVFDMAVHMGISPAIKCAQRACWAVMRKRGIIEDDGILGNDTISMINSCGTYLLPAIRSERAGYHKLICEHNPDQKVFLDGWLNRSYGG